MKHILIYIFTCLFSTLTFGQTEGPPTANYKLVWQDEFNGTSLDTTKWFYRAEGTLREFGIPIRENVSLDGKGHLIIKATKKDSTYYCGQIASRLDQLFRYGYFECRIKVNRSKGPSTAFWMKSIRYGKIPGDPAQSGTEVDILEYRRKYHSDRLCNTIHWVNKEGNHTQNTKTKRFSAVEEGFHTYGLEWTPKRYIFYVDGKKYWKTRGAVSNAFHYLILSVELNGWSGDPTKAVYPDWAVYDYVRVWELTE